jgi:peptidoglycan L-alanyl-D-glutamate endopeptidase CwlK
MPSTRLTDCDTHLAAQYTMLLHDFREQTGHDLLITCTARSTDEQAKLYAQGRSTPGPIVTQLDGTTHKSKHNLVPSRAIDVAVVVGGKVSWDATQYAPLGPLATHYGLTWGGSWRTLKDYPHLEID